MKLSYELEITNIDQTIEKAKQLCDLLREAQQLINSLSSTNLLKS